MNKCLLIEFNPQWDCLLNGLTENAMDEYYSTSFRLGRTIVIRLRSIRKSGINTDRRPLIKIETEPGHPLNHW